MAFIYRYQIYNQNIRKEIDLNEYRDNIIEGIKVFYENNLKDCRVEKEFYEYRLHYKVSNRELRKAGKRILQDCEELKEKIRKGKTSINSKYFERKQQKYYAYIERDEMEKSTKLHLIDYADFNDINRFSANARNKIEEFISKSQSKQEGYDSKSILSNNALAVAFYMDVFTITIKNENGINFEEYINDNNNYDAVIVEGHHREDFFYHRIISELDIEELLETNKQRNVERLIDGFKINKLHKTDDEEAKRITESFTVPYSKSSFIKNFENMNYKNVNFFVHNVGQALTTSLSEKGKPPFIFFDFGISEGRNLFNRPSIMDIDLSEKPSIVISHIHRDHWFGLTVFTESFECDWYLPNQKKELLFEKRCAEITASGGSVSYIDTTISSNLGTIFIGCSESKCKRYRRPSNQHEDGLGMKLRLFNEKSNSYVNVLVPGDQNYDYIPQIYLEEIDVLVASHHGGKYSWSSRQAVSEDIPNNSNKGRIIYSYGRCNTHNHPSKIDDYELKGWIRRHDTMTDFTYDLKKDLGVK